MGYRSHTEGNKCLKCSGAPVIARKLCRPCYERSRRNGTIHQYAILGPADAFWPRVQKGEGCWKWTGHANAYGYGIFLLPGEIPVRAHRHAYELTKGPIPAGKVIMHSCDNPICVNPDHLSAGTRGDNNADAARKGRRPHGMSHWATRLTEAQVLEIRSSVAPQRLLSSMYSVSQGTISRIRTGKRRQKI